MTAMRSRTAAYWVCRPATTVFCAVTASRLTFLALSSVRSVADSVTILASRAFRSALAVVSAASLSLICVLSVFSEVCSGVSWFCSDRMVFSAAVIEVLRVPSCVTSLVTSPSSLVTSAVCSVTAVFAAVRVACSAGRASSSALSSPCFLAISAFAAVRSPVRPGSAASSAAISAFLAVTAALALVRSVFAAVCAALASASVAVALVTCWFAPARLVCSPGSCCCRLLLSCCLADSCALRYDTYTQRVTDHKAATESWRVITEGWLVERARRAGPRLSGRPSLRGGEVTGPR